MTKINISQKTKLILVLAVEFIAISVILLLIFFAGKKSYNVHFDLNGGILISGSEHQRVTQGQNATPPDVAKDGHYLKGWSGSYHKITSNVTLRAIWEYETTPGIIYGDHENRNYAEITGSYKELRGEVYIGAYYEEKMVLSINEGAFRGRTGITGVYLLDGILAIESGAFEDCTNMEKIDIPATVVRIGEGAFKGCKSLKTLVLPNSLVEIEDGAFEGCESLEEIVFGEIEDESQTDKNKNKPQDNTALGEVEEEKPSITRIGARAFRGCKNLKSVMLPEGLLKIDALAFSGCESLTEIVIPESVENIAMGVFDTDSLTINLYFSESEMPEGFSIGWYIGQGVTLVYDYQPPEPEVDEPVDEPWWNLGGGNKDGDKNSNNK